MLIRKEFRVKPERTHPEKSSLVLYMIKELSSLGMGNEECCIFSGGSTFAAMETSIYRVIRNCIPEKKFTLRRLSKTEIGVWRIK